MVYQLENYCQELGLDFCISYLSMNHPECKHQIVFKEQGTDIIDITYGVHYGSTFGIALAKAENFLTVLINE